MQIISKIAEVISCSKNGEKLIKKIRSERNRRLAAIRVSSAIGDKRYVLVGTHGDEAYWYDTLKKRTGKNAEVYLTIGDIEDINGVNCKVCSMEEIMSMDRVDEILFVIIPCNRVMSIIEKLSDYGIKRDTMIIASREGSPEFGGKLLDHYDVTLGFSREDDLPGFVVFGKDKVENGGANKRLPYVIVTLGGSTTDAYYANFKSWSEILYTKLSAVGIDVVVYCGGICSYTSGQELQKLIRDVLLLKPDMVLSYSGANDQKNCLKEEGVEGHPAIRKFQYQCMNALIHKIPTHRLTWITSIYNADRLTCGLDDNRSSAQFWVDNERMMHAVCKEFGIVFHGFLQPSPEIGGYLKDDFINYSGISGYKGYTDEVSSWYKEATSAIRSIDYLTDLSGIFSGMSGIFYDECHVFEKGNKIIAEQIFRKIVRDIRSSRRQEVSA